MKRFFKRLVGTLLFSVVFTAGFVSFSHLFVKHNTLTKAREEWDNLTSSFFVEAVETTELSPTPVVAKQEEKLADNISIEAPHIKQLPELPRGCEVTSLAMLLQHAKISVDKMELASNIKKDLTPYEKKDGKTFFGNPHKGFIGNMYTYSEPGYGVYHEPIAELANTYLPGRITNLTGKDFNEVMKSLNEDKPVWIITNTTFAPLDASYFETFHTPDGEIPITMKEHSVLVTGYDTEYIYFNNPLTDEKYSKASRDRFIDAWKQMGSQAITYKD
ncbi:C39 family peptidase [Priestia taiwanensis]|uniref:Peptidase C39-like domain-containing protein n=1 Tax=Priestia taiwanensis TaxID=1347902 RepID=A0A917AL92_9BACI|nr:C39 family peptidase [Priestia taiwanensis]MBM7362089.1 uncharacterized protein YvpB [Priestia taiwanensis]GGE59363.1 hypothetical protein GCM10007140_07120 [Priestia taiwanensis]